MKNIVLLAVFCFAATVTFAQQRTAANAPRSQQEMEYDEQFVTKAIAGGTAEMRKGALARKKSKNAEIIRYGEMMERDHHAVNSKLKETAQRRGDKISEQLPNNLQQSYNTLEKLDGLAFDREYVSQMVKDHRETIDLFQQQAKNGSDQDLKDIANSALPTLQEHLRQIEQLQKTIDKK
ncbi:DUF4142 domain-containing protein [Flavobacterium sp. JP2137]|uniref:DUF4142 domain-containing protein n=1 Tax=Flavobacterium sp. JP2137 TaxID=3414510 RepID=UPI003D2FF30F